MINSGHFPLFLTLTLYFVRTLNLRSETKERTPRRLLRTPQPLADLTR